MPDLHLGTQVFDFVFNPQHDVVYTGLLTGHIKAFSYDDAGECTPKFSLWPTKKTIRSLAINPDGLELYSVSKDRSIHTIDTTTGKITNERLRAHDSAINRVTRFMSMLATGDDDGVIKLWDPRQPASVRSYTHHRDFISDFLWLEDKKHLLATSGDATLSALDIRSSKTTPFAQSEDQEDELLSAVSIKDGAKVAIGTQTGIISIWNRSSGWGDCVDRVPGHPHSVDALASLTPDVIATGSSDGLVRVVQLLPHKLLGVIADHGTFPIERLHTDRNGAWLGSASHDDVLKLTDVRDALVDSDDEDGGSDGGDSDESSQADKTGDVGSVDEDSSSDDEDLEEEKVEVDEGKQEADQSMDAGSSDSDSEPDPQPKPEPEPPQPDSDSEQEQPDKRSRKRKKKEGAGGLDVGRDSKKGKMDDGFFDEL